MKAGRKEGAGRLEEHRRCWKGSTVNRAGRALSHHDQEHGLLHHQSARTNKQPRRLQSADPDPGQRLHAEKRSLRTGSLSGARQGAAQARGPSGCPSFVQCAGHLSWPSAVPFLIDHCHLPPILQTKSLKPIRGCP